jgi:alkanesulfonate monooxygenase SsuD/methylene tetrahydromethanopterin reductase-like flavin-dependent oxidoreductase (luciferase family)
VIASVPVCVTDDPGPVRESIATILASCSELPSYRAMLDREEADGPADVAIIGDEAQVSEGLVRFADAGATDFGAVEFALNAEDGARTRALLKSF